MNTVGFLHSYHALVSSGWSTGEEEREAWMDAIRARLDEDGLKARVEVVWNALGGHHGSYPWGMNLEIALARLLAPDGGDYPDPAAVPRANPWRRRKELREQVRRDWGASLEQARLRVEAELDAADPRWRARAARRERREKSVCAKYTLAWLDEIIRFDRGEPERTSDAIKLAWVPGRFSAERYFWEWLTRLAHAHGIDGEEEIADFYEQLLAEDSDRPERLAAFAEVRASRSP
jgi:hypothetical protein